MESISEIQRGGSAGAGLDMARTLTVLVAWFFVAVWLGVTGALLAEGTPPIGLAAAIGLPLVAFAIDGRFGHPLFGGLLRLELPALVALQTFRVVGVIFVVGWMGGTLPAGFALPAGLGDIAVGVSAPFVAAAVANRRPHHRRWLRVWNTFGTIDLIAAVTLGVLHSGSALGILAGPVTTDALARYPYSVVPTFLVPLALMLHFIVRKTTTRATATATTATATAHTR
jgi:hypothetical protein